MRKLHTYLFIGSPRVLVLCVSTRKADFHWGWSEWVVGDRKSTNAVKEKLNSAPVNAI